jgi:hypothetical protein
MKKLIPALLLSLIPFVSYAQVPNPGWELDTVMDGFGHPTGYIYETSAVGHQCSEECKKLDFEITELRLICSVKGKSDPIIAIFWNRQQVSSRKQSVEVKIDMKVVPNTQSYEWTQEGPLTYRSYTDSTELLNLMKTGHMISFGWVEDSTEKKYTVFTLRDFSSNLDNFISFCNL